MAKTQFLTYYICLNDPALVEAHQNTQWIPAVTVPGTIPLGIVNRAPLGAADEFAAPFRGFTQPFAPGENYTWTPFSGIGEEDGPFPLNVATFTRKTGGFWGIGGTTTRYYWMGQFVYVPPATASVGGVPAPPVDIATVCWADGFELPSNGEGASIFTLDTYSPAASRRLDGLGLAIRGNTGALQKTHQWNETGVLGGNPSEGWTRFYIRLRRAPDVLGKFWDCRTNTSSTPAASLKFTSGRTLQLWTIQSTVESFHSNITGFTFELDVWYRLDILLRVGLNPPNDGRFRLYVNGALVYDVQITTNEGLGGGGASPRLTDCRMSVDGAISNMDLDVDDWSGHALPNGTNPAFPEAGSFTGLDWLNGSMVALVRANAFGPGHGAWTGDVRQLQQRPVGNQPGAGPLISTTSGEVMEVETDYDLAVKARNGYLAMSALVPAAFHNRAVGTADSILGYALDGAAFTSVNISGGTTEGWDNTFLSRAGVGVERPAEITGPLRLRFTKSADVTQVNVRSLAAAALLIGQFGAEDAPPEVEVNNAAETAIGIHNHPYPRTPWALGGLPPLAPIAIIGGTYTGNNLAQDLQSAIPAHWYWVRPLTGALGGVQWWSSMLGAHAQQDLSVRPDVMVRARQNELFNGAPGEEAQSQEFALTPSGTYSQANATAVVYQFIAVCDPGQRVMLNGAFKHGNALASYDNLLPDAGFTPQYAFFFPEEKGNTTTNHFRGKGPGNAATAWQVLTGTAEQATAIEFGEGFIRSLLNAHNLTADQVAFSAWRDDDGILDAAGASQRGKAVQIWSYVGDGAASRSMSFPVAVGRRPMFALIAPITNAAAFFRDPSHTANNSCDVANTNSTTAITAGGLDSITVGSSLNANGVTYNVFLIVGGTTAGNGGWGINETIIPMEPDTAPGDQWDDPFPGEPTTPTTGGTANPLDPGDLDTDIAADCVASSTRLCNLALHEAGITKQLANLSTDTSQEAFVCRMVYKTIVDQVLRAFAWGFARTYSSSAGLTQVAGPGLPLATDTDPANPDWTYSYALPSNCLRVLRVVDQVGGRRKQTIGTPIAFEVLQDDTPRDLLYTNEPEEVLASDDPVIVEYIRRVPCPGRVTDAVFRQCLVYRLANAIAMPLGKDQKTADALLAKYRDLLPQDKVLHANEREPQRPIDVDPDWITGR